MIQNPNEKEFYKFKTLKTYGALESLFQGQKKYRYVYDEAQTCYLNVELALYNLLFDKEDWATSVTFRALEYYSKRQICNFRKEVTVKKDQNIVYIRDGWGTSKPGFWKKGTYKWEAYVRDVLVKEAYFYVTNIGVVTASHNPFFNIKSLKFFESPREGIALENRKYLRTFAHNTARYVNLEVILENLLTEESHFPLELQFNFYNELLQLKGASVTFRNIYDKRAEIVLDTGYGTANPGFWAKGKYTLTILFMDTLIAELPFEVGDEEIALFPNQASPESSDPFQAGTPPQA